MRKNECLVYNILDSCDNVPPKFTWCVQTYQEEAEEQKEMRKIWKIWKYALGSFLDETTIEYDDIICCIRSLIMLQLVVTNCFIIGGNIRHWNDHHTRPSYEHIRN